MMEQDCKIPMTYEGTECGHAEQRRNGLYWEIEGRCDMVTEEVMRAYGRRGDTAVCLGVLIPEEGKLCFRKRMAASGLPEDGFEEVTVGQPTPLWKPWDGVDGGLSRMVGGKRWIAVPYDENRPMEDLSMARFCTPEKIDGKMYLTLEAERWEEADSPCTGEESVVS